MLDKRKITRSYRRKLFANNLALAVKERSDDPELLELAEAYLKA